MATSRINLYNTDTGAKLNPGETYLNKTGQQVTQGTTVGTFNTPTSTTPVNANQIQSNPSVMNSLPTPQPQTPGVLPVNTADALMASQDQTQTPEAKQYETDTQSLSNLYTGLAGKAADTAAALQSTGINDFKQQLQGISAQVKQKNAEIQQSDIQLIANQRAEETRNTLLPFAQMGQAKLAGDAAILRALKVSEVGILNAQAQTMQGNIELAKQTAQDAVDAKYAPIEEGIAIKSKQLELAKPFMDASEKKQAEKNAILLEGKKTDLADQKALEKEQRQNEIQNQKDIQEIAVEVAKNGGDVTKLSSAKTPLEALRLAGSSLIGKNNELIKVGEQQLLVDKNTGKVLQRYGIGGNVVSPTAINDATATWATAIKNGTATLSQVPDGLQQKVLSAINTSTINADDTITSPILGKINVINDLINHRGLNVSVGVAPFSRTTLFKGDVWSGDKSDFIAGIQQLISKDTLDTLINLKKAGGTLGALSDQERIMLKSAASKIGTWEDKNKSGEIVGYSASEKAFKKELDVIKNLSQKAYIQAGGLPEDIGAQTTPDGKMWVINSDGTLTQI